MLYDLIVIGGGPAGITAGIYAARQKLKTLLITKDFGGQIARKAVAIENYPGYKEISGIELIQKFKEHLKKFEIEIEKDSVTKIEKINKNFIVSTEDKKQFKARVVIIASGADPRPLEVPGEKEFIGRGVSYCAVCDGPLFKDKTVAVIGGGNAGFEEALFLSNFAKKIYILEYGATVKANETNQEKAKKTGKIEVINSAALKEIKGNKFVNSIVYQDLNSKENKTLEVQGVFVAIGSRPATFFVKDLVEFNHFINQLDEIEINPRTCETNTPGLFAAGDVSDVKYKQVVIAAGEGAKAALSAYEYLQKL
ncbi:FAD-dependent oxidoreductase [Patescibacteria group bacterium]|nr:FAD-dependent oxidoreductase [Patescibacteria group bacterium]